MIRKAVIVVLTLGAVGAAAAGILSYTTYPSTAASNEFGQWRAVVFWNGKLSFVETIRLATDHYSDTLVEEGRRGWEVLMHDPTGTEYLGFYWHNVPVLSVDGQTIMVHCQINIPLWAPCVMFSWYPTIAFIRGPLRRWRRRKRGECINCGYNLTGNVTGVCSECGT